MNQKTKRVSIILSAILFAMATLASVLSFADDTVTLADAFPDAVFRAAVALHYDTDKDGALSPEERSTDVMIVSGLLDELAESRGVDSDALEISSLQGIEHFGNLRVLRCNNVGELGTLDVSELTQLEWLDCSDDGLTALDLSANTALKRLHCCSNEFTALDVTANTNLEFLHCYANLELQSLNVSGLTNLEELRCDGCNLTELDLSSNTALYTLNCSHNHLSKLDLANTSASSLTNYHLGNQSITLEMIYDGKIKAPLALDENAVYATSLDDGETAYADGAFFTEDYEKIKDGFTYQYSVGRSGCAEMQVSVSVFHSHTYAVSASDLQNKTLTIACRICGDSHTLDAALSTAQTDPDCTNNGLLTQTLSGEYESLPYTDKIETVLPALGHDYRSVVTNPTCTEQGYTTYTCTRCQDSYTDTYTNATGHTPADAVRENEVAATCTAGGSYDAVVYCSTCQAELSRTPQTVDPLGHNYSAWTESTAAVAPTCTEKGKTAVETCTCSRCQDVQTRGGADVDALGHNYNSVVTNPTCTENGYTTHTCSRCQDSYTDTYTNATGHTPADAVRENEVAPTCTAGGSYDEVVYCSVCKAELSRTPQNVDPLGHNYSAWAESAAAVAPTCTEKGKTAVETCTCSRCQDVQTRGGADVDALGHNYNPVVTNPTCTEQGYTTYTCTRCQDSYTDTYTNATGHTPADAVRENEVAATCTAGGSYDAVVYCSTCQAELSRTPQTVDSLGHNYSAWTESAAAVAPTCTEKGKTAVETCTCSRCQDVQTRGGADVDALGHNYNSVVTNPTCTENGYTTHTCTRCQDSYTDTYTNATGHTPADAVRENEVAPTCTAGGSYDAVVYCSVCEAEISRTPQTVDPLGHDYRSVLTNPTCTEQGYTTHTCSRCQDSFADAYTDPLGHTWDAGTVTVEPTTESEGKTKFTCTVCGATRYEAIAKIPIKEITPTEQEGDNAKVNKKIKKPSQIHTISYIKKKQLYIHFSPVKGAQNYRIMYRAQGAKKWKKAWTKGKTEYTLKNLKKNGLYEFKFAAYKKNAKGKWERGNYSTTSYRYLHKTDIKKVTVKKQKVTLSWTRDKAAQYYIVQYATNKEMNNSTKIKVSPNSKTSLTVKGLKKGKTYYIRVRCVKKKGGKDYYGEYSNRKTFKIK